MSKYMQIKVSVQAYYPEGIRQTYPKLARQLAYLAAELVEQNPSLYALAGQWDKLLYVFDGTPLKEVLRRPREQVVNLHRRIEAYIADWKLAEADRLLYSLEDIFADMEAELTYEG